MGVVRVDKKSNYTRQNHAKRKKTLNKYYTKPSGLYDAVGYSFLAMGDTYVQQWTLKSLKDDNDNI